MRLWARLWIIGCLCLKASLAWTMSPRPVVVELFESQGCSSCPPSERVMSGLRREFGASVLLLTYHVDYWDYLGWKDPFSDPRCTARQKMYGQAFAQDSIYTPEMIIDGEAGFLGSDWNHAREEVQSRLGRNGLPMTISLAPKGPTSASLTIQISSELAKASREILAVIYENAPPVHVLRGENRGETMSGDFAVRSHKQIPISTEGRSATHLTLPPGANPAQTSIAVLIRGDSSAILTAESLPWPKTP